MRTTLILIAIWILASTTAGPAPASDSLVFDFTTLAPGFYTNSVELPGYTYVLFALGPPSPDGCYAGQGGAALADEEGLSLLNSSLEIWIFDTWYVSGVERCEVDVLGQSHPTDATLGNCSDPPVVAEGAGPVTLSVDIDQVAYFSCGSCTVTEVRLVGANIIPVFADSWSALKARYDVTP